MPAGHGQRPSEIIRAAVARGALTAERARYWLEKAADGEDVSIVAAMQGTGPLAVSWPSTGPLRTAAAADDDGDGMTEQERADWAALYPPVTAAEAEKPPPGDRGDGRAGRALFG